MKTVELAEVDQVIQKFLSTLLERHGRALRDRKLLEKELCAELMPDAWKATRDATRVEWTLKIGERSLGLGEHGEKSRRPKADGILWFADRDEAWSEGWMAFEVTDRRNSKIPYDVAKCSAEYKPHRPHTDNAGKALFESGYACGRHSDTYLGGIVIHLSPLKSDDGCKVDGTDSDFSFDQWVPSETLTRNLTHPVLTYCCSYHTECGNPIRRRVLLGLGAMQARKSTSPVCELPAPENTQGHE